MSALIPKDESHKNKLNDFMRRERALKFPAIPLKHLPSYMDCPDEVELEYPCGDKSKDTVNFSDWSYFKNQCPPEYRERSKGRWAKHDYYSGKRRDKKLAAPYTDDSSVGDMSISSASSASSLSSLAGTAKVVSRKSCAGWSPELLRRLRQPLKTDREMLAEKAAKKKKTPRPRKTYAQHLMEELHPIHERESDVSAVSASTESHVPRARTPPERISQEELHRRFLEQQEAEFQASLESVKGSRKASANSEAAEGEGGAGESRARAAEQAGS